MKANNRQPPRPARFCHALLTVLGIWLATNARADTTLKDACRDDFLIGVALKPSQFCGYDAIGSGHTNIVAYVPIPEQEFDARLFSLSSRQEISKATGCKFGQKLLPELVGIDL